MGVEVRTAVQTVGIARGQWPAGQERRVAQHGQPVGRDLEPRRGNSLFGPILVTHWARDVGVELGFFLDGFGKNIGLLFDECVGKVRVHGLEHA